MAADQTLSRGEEGHGDADGRVVEGAGAVDADQQLEHDRADSDRTGDELDPLPVDREVDADDLVADEEDEGDRDRGEEEDVAEETGTEGVVGYPVGPLV